MMRILTGIDLPRSPTCGSMILARDLYTRWPTDVRFVCIESDQPSGFMDDMEVVEHRDHPARLSTDRRAYFEALALCLSSQLDSYRPDVVHVHHLTFGMATCWLEVLPPQTPVVAFCHGTDILAAWDDARHARTVREMLRRAHVTVFPTEATRQQAIALAPEMQDRFYTVPWGLPEDAFVTEAQLRQRVTSQTAGRRLVYAGRVNANKDVDTIIRAMAQLPHDHLTIVGPKETHEALRALIQQVDVQRQVTVLPFLPRRQLWSLFDAHDALIISTSCLEAFGLTAMEAMARGLDVIYASVEGLSEVLEPVGRPYAPGDADALAVEVRALGDEAHQHRPYDAYLHARQYTLDRTIHTLEQLTAMVLAHG